MAVNIQKLLPQTNNNAASTRQEKLYEIKSTAIKIEKLLKRSVSAQKKKVDTKRKEQEDKRYKKKEDELEKKEAKKESKTTFPSLPRTGFLDWIKNFITNIVLGYFSTRLLNNLPALKSVASFAGKTLGTVIDAGGKILNGLATFIDWGYKAYDATRGFIKDIGGSNAEKLFDDFINSFEKFLDYSLILAYSFRPKGKGPKAPPTKPPGGTGGGFVSGFLSGFAVCTAGGGAMKKVTTKAGATVTATQFNKQLKQIQEVGLSARVNAFVQQGYTRKQAVELAKELGARTATTTRTLAVAEPPPAGRPPIGPGVKKTKFYQKPTSVGDFVLGLMDPRQQLDIMLDKAADGKISIDQLRKFAEKQVRSGKLDAGDLDFIRTLDKKALMDFREQSFRASRSGQMSGAADLTRAVQSDVYQEVGKAKPPNKLTGAVKGAGGIKGIAGLAVVGSVIDLIFKLASGEKVSRAIVTSAGSGVGGVLGGILGTAITGGVAFFSGGFGAILAPVIIGGISIATAALFETVLGAIYDFADKRFGFGFANGGLAKGKRATANSSPVVRGISSRQTKAKLQSEPPPTDLKPGYDIGGEKEIKKLFPEDKINQEKNTYGYINQNYDVLSEVDFFGPLLGISIKTMMGDKPSSVDYRNASIGLSNWMLTTFGAMGRPGYAGGGLVSRGMFVAPKNLIETVQRSIQDSISSDINESIADLRTRIGGMVSLPSLFDRSASAAATMKTQRKQTGYESVPGNFNIVQYITGDPSQGANYDFYGHGTRDNYHDHIAFATEADKEKAKAALRAAGIQIGSEFRFGDPGYHGSNLAIDIPGSQWGGTGAIGQKEYDGSAKVRQILGLFGGGPTGEGGLIKTHPGEYIIDKDSVDLYGIPFFDIINQTENESQRKQNSLSLMGILKNYASYEYGSDQTVVVSVPEPQMIPVPIPSSGGGSISIQPESTPSGQYDILEMIG